MGTVYQRGKVYYIDVRVNGRRLRKRVGTSKKTAELAAKDLEVRAAREEFGFAVAEISVGDFVKRFMDHSRANHRPATTQRYKSVTDHFVDFVENHCDNVKSMSQLTPEIMERYKVYRKESLVNPNGERIETEKNVRNATRMGARAKTINFELSALRTMVNLAKKWNYLKNSPMEGVKPLKADRTSRPRYLESHEIKALLDATPKELYPIFYTFLNTGMREGELLNLTWEDVDFTRNKLIIRFKEDWSPKTGEREIPLNKGMQELLSSVKSTTRYKGKKSYVFPGIDGKKLRSKLRDKLIRVAKKADIADLTKLHTFRHTFASQLVMKGVDLTTVKDLLGHTDIQTTMIYSHLAPGHLANAVDKLEF